MDSDNPTPIDSAVEGDFQPAHDLIEIERERIKSVRLAIEANDASDQRAFDYHMARLDSDTKIRTEQLRIARTMMYGGSALAALMILALFGLLFFGNAEQSHLASVMLEKLVSALGGIGVYLLGRHTLNKLTRGVDY